MFTGIITEIGTVKGILRKDSSMTRIELYCKKVQDSLDVGGSVSVNGVCLSIVEKKKDALSFDVVANTLRKTNLKRLKASNKVNLESALKLGDTLSGHMVSGHVDGERMVKANGASSKGWVMDITLLAEEKKYLIPKGSVAIDGVSLTIGEIYPRFMRMYLIPHTLEKTTLQLKKAGDYVNLEIDMMAKYAREKSSASNITMDSLRDKGFMVRRALLAHHESAGKDILHLE